MMTEIQYAKRNDKTGTDGLALTANNSAQNVLPARTRLPIWATALGHRPAGLLQTKLTIGQPNDPYEQEADQVAEQVMLMPDPAATSPSLASQTAILQRKCACGGEAGPDGECKQCKAKRLGLQRKATLSGGDTGRGEGNIAPPIVHDVLRSSGQPLDVTTQAFMKPRLGHNFDQVRVHADAEAAESARAVGALAYTVGHHVVFGAGQYTLHTAEGKRLLAHELTHVMQQTHTMNSELQTLRRATFRVGTRAVEVNYGNLVNIPIVNYQNAIEAAVIRWAGNAALTPSVQSAIAGLNDSQREWVLYGLDVLEDNSVAAPGLARDQAVQRLIARAPSATTRPLGVSNFNFENEVLQVSGWFEAALPATLTAPSGPTRTALQQIYNPPPSPAAPPSGTLDVATLNSMLPPLLTALLTGIDPANWASTGTQSIATLQSVADTIQGEARSLFAPFADTAISNAFSRGWQYSANLFSAASVTPGPDMRLGYMRNRAEIVGRMSHADLVQRLNNLGVPLPSALPVASVFADVNFESSDTTHMAALESLITTMDANATIQGIVTRLLQQTGRTDRSAGHVFVPTQFNAANVTECTARWRAIGTISHELVHVLVHPSFPANASSIGFGQIIREGFTEVLGNQLYDRLRARAGDAAFKGQMEAGIAAPCPPPTAVPIGYGAAGTGAEQVRSRVGDNNFRAAYFLGAVNLVGL